MQLAASVVDLIGHTPLVALDRLTAGLPGRILAKAECLNPGGSVKDRCAWSMLRAALSRGDLAPGGWAVELTSGNMGTGLAIAAQRLGVRFLAVMSEGNSIERARMMRALGAEVVLVPQAPGSRSGQVSGADLDLVRQRAAELAAERGAWYVDQFHNPDNVTAHDVTTGAEILAQTGGRLDAFVTAAGTGCTFVGVMRHLRRHGVGAQGYVVEPAGAAVIGGGAVTNPSHRLQGIGYAQVPPQWDPSLCNGSLAVTDDEAIAVARRLAAEEGLFVGFSSGANVAAAMRLLGSTEPGSAPVVVTILCDTGLKYLSTDLVP
ncbi:MAG: cysteine synthase family protein [Armatimonadetes bacterium]|nr:cysteine synthase family protein [Armatimonadota bacterium]